jgi:ATP-dependent DNA helicase RecG
MFNTPQSLLDKIRLGEDSLLELKSVRFRGKKIAGPARDELANELAAFANANGGVLVLGVDDKTREIDGLPLEKLDAVETYIRQICNDAAAPPLFAKIVRTELPGPDGGKRPVLKIDIPQSLFVHEGPGGYFQRLGSSKRKMPPDVLARLFRQRSQARLIRFDEQPVPETDRSTLSEYLWRRFIPAEESDPILALQKMRLLTADDNGAERARN